MNSTVGHPPQLHEIARERFLLREGKPLFLGDWLRAAFIHYEIDPAILQPHIPFPLDLRDGKAYVSLVAFTMNRLRPRIGGKCSEFLFKPIATHEFFNVRTYVCHNGEPAIYFIAEWLSNWLSTQLGPLTYGLPYRFARIDYQHQHEERSIDGTVRMDTKQFAYQSETNGADFARCPEGSLSEFLLERYTAFTSSGNTRRLFRIWHEPWLQQPIEMEVHDQGLLTCAGEWFQHAKLIAANYSPGVHDVWMSQPHRVSVSR